MAACAHGVAASGDVINMYVALEQAASLSQRDATGMFLNTATDKPYDGIVEVCSRYGGTRRAICGATATLPQVQILPGGETLIVAPRCRRRSAEDIENNAAVFAPDGTIARRFCLGDGIEDVQVSTKGDLWVSYFDEGVIGNRGWKHPMGANGLVRFNSHGERQWGFTPEVILDCYALNVAADCVWAYYYTEFELARIDAEGGIERWPTAIRGARAVAVGAHAVFFAGGYATKRLSEANLCLWQKGQLSKPESVELAIDSADINEASWLGARLNALRHHTGCVVHARHSNASLGKSGHLLRCFRESGVSARHLFQIEGCREFARTDFFRAQQQSGAIRT